MALNTIKRLFSHLIFQFIWLDGDGTTISEGITTITEEIENTKRITAISTLKLTAKKSHHNKNITCQAQNPADPSPNSVGIKLLGEFIHAMVIFCYTNWTTPIMCIFVYSRGKWKKHKKLLLKCIFFVSVEYAPHVTISVDHSPVKEFDKVVFKCNAHANPSVNMQYRYVCNLQSTENQMKEQYHFSAVLSEFQST